MHQSLFILSKTLELLHPSRYVTRLMKKFDQIHFQLSTWWTWSTVVRSLGTLATLPVYINSSKMEVAPSAANLPSSWNGVSDEVRFPDASLPFTRVIGAEKLPLVFGSPHYGVMEGVLLPALWLTVAYSQIHVSPHGYGGFRRVSSFHLRRAGLLFRHGDVE